jgi:hypothetical protein
MAISKIISESLDLTDNYAFTGTITGAGESNTPAFFAHSSGTQTGISDATWTKATLGTEIFDTDNAFASDKFTVPTGKGGKYCFFFKINSAGSTDYQKTGYSALYKNGSELPNSGILETVIFQESGVFNMDRIGIHGSVILDLSAGDYIELYGQADVNSGTVNFYHSFLSGYKIF